MNMKCSSLFCIILCISIEISSADSDNLCDTCPATTSTTSEQALYINGFPCKNPNSINASDFMSSSLSQAGDTDNVLRSSTNMVTAADLAGLNTLGLSVARTDLEVDGMVMPHSHPRAAEMFYVSKGVVIAGFIDTKSKLFQKKLNAGDVFVFPRGLLHFCFNNGYETAVVYSVLNSQNPGVVTIADAMFGSSQLEEEMVGKLVRKIKLSHHALENNGIEE